MSGICAIWRKGGLERTASTLADMSGALEWCARKQSEQKTDGNIGVGLSAGSDLQQIYENPRLLLACDAELYNENELRALSGSRETQVPALLAVMYERFGAGFVEKLRGAFSLILWDRQERNLLAAVDGFGIRRLTYYEDGHALLIASRIDALLASGEVPRDVNPRAIVNVLNFGAVLGPETIYTKVQRLQPGTFLLASEGQTQIRKYWDMRYDAGTDSNEDRLSRKLESVVERAVAAHCKDDSFDGIGAFLSGGTDSSTIVGMMSRMGRGPVKTFSIGFEEQPFNELGYAELAAKAFHADHHTYLVGPRDCFDALPQMVRSFDEPFGNSSAIPTYFCARLAAQNGVKTLLAGDGGDELFGGNEWYETDKIFQVYQKVPPFLRKGLIEPVLGWMPMENGIIGKARRYVRRSNLAPLERVLSYHFVCAHSPAEIFTGDFLTTVGAYSPVEIPSKYYDEAPARDHLDRLLYVDVKTIIGDSDLPKVTCMAELAGIQARFPFLDRAVSEFSGEIPPRLKVKGFEKRYLFKRAFRNLLPAEIIQKKKHGFGIPVATWMKSDPRMRELSRDVLLSQRAFERGYFRRDFIEDLFRKHESDDSSYYGDTLWTFLTLELWHRQAVDEPVRLAI